MKLTLEDHESHVLAAAVVEVFDAQCQHQQLKGKISHRGIGPRAIFIICWITAMMLLGTAQARSQTSATNSTCSARQALEPSNTNIWQNGIGQGFKPGTQSISINTGAGVGFVSFLGGQQHHDLTFASLSYGCMLGSVKGQGHWYQGNWELRGELFGGAQFSPTSEWFVGLTPHLRYNFATGTRWVPYVDGGAGVTATSIGPPDLSHYFEFNLQAATGVRWFIRDNVALGIEARYIHMSCAGINQPNLGLNNVNTMLGVSWFF